MIDCVPFTVYRACDLRRGNFPTSALWTYLNIYISHVAQSVVCAIWYVQHLFYSCIYCRSLDNYVNRITPKWIFAIAGANSVYLLPHPSFRYLYVIQFQTVQVELSGPSLLLCLTCSTLSISCDYLRNRKVNMKCWNVMDRDMTNNRGQQHNLNWFVNTRVTGAWLNAECWQSEGKWRVYILFLLLKKWVVLWMVSIAITCGNVKIDGSETAP
jgi:hypothetical protein